MHPEHNHASKGKHSALILDVPGFARILNPRAHGVHHVGGTMEVKSSGLVLIAEAQARALALACESQDFDRARAGLVAQSIAELLGEALESGVRPEAMPDNHRESPVAFAA